MLLPHDLINHPVTDTYNTDTYNKDACRTSMAPLAIHALKKKNHKLLTV